MDFELPGQDDPRRTEVRQWFEEHPDPSPRELAERGLVAPHWPRPYGLDADPIHQIVIDEEMRAAGVTRPINTIGIGWAGPTLLHAGSDAQQQRYLPPLLSGEEIWCQLFSEPEAGSDLAGLGTRAVRDGDEWVINGSKIWTSGAQFSAFGILIARTEPDVGKHEGITYFICPMDADGIEVRPIVEMTGMALFNEVFLTDVRLPLDAVVGEVNRGWGLAKVTLGNERVSLSGGGGAVGAWPHRPRPVGRDPWQGWDRRPSASPTGGPAPHPRRDPPADPIANRYCCHQGRTARPGVIGAQGARRRARPGGHGAGQGPGGSRGEC